MRASLLFIAVTVSACEGSTVRFGPAQPGERGDTDDAQSGPQTDGIAPDEDSAGDAGGQSDAKDALVAGPLDGADGGTTDATDAGERVSCPELEPFKLPLAVACDREACPGAHPSELDKCYGTDTVPIACPASPATPECANTDYCGQDAQYGSTRDPSVRCVTRDGDDAVSDPSTGLLWLAKRIEWQLYAEAEHACPPGFRLPSAHELFSLVDFRRTWGMGDLIDHDLFGDGSDLEFWTRTREDPRWVVAVDFVHGSIHWQQTDSRHLGVLCVWDRVVETGVHARFERRELAPEQSVVEDRLTQLTWQPRVADDHDWRAALAECETSTHAGFEDWRLPNIRELTTLIEFGLYPASSAPIDFGSKALWSGSVSARSANSALIVQIRTGQSWSIRRSESHACLCVRSDG